MKLYIWEDDVLTDYSSGMMFAIAPSLEEAIKLILEYDSTVEFHDSYKDFIKNVKEYDLDKPICRTIWGGA